MNDNTDDLALLKLIAEGNQAAFQTLFTQYHPKLIYFLVGLTHDLEVSKDIAQELFMTLWDKRGNLLAVDSISSYLFTSAKYRVYDHFDKLNVRSKYQIEQLLNPADINSPEEELFVLEIETVINQLIEKMPARQKEVFILSRKYGLTNDEIAQKLHINKKTVENHLTNSLSIIRKTILLLMISFF